MCLIHDEELCILLVWEDLSNRTSDLSTTDYVLLFKHDLSTLFFVKQSTSHYDKK